MLPNLARTAKDVAWVEVNLKHVTPPQGERMNFAARAPLTHGPFPPWNLAINLILMSGTTSGGRDCSQSPFVPFLSSPSRDLTMLRIQFAAADRDWAGGTLGEENCAKQISPRAPK